MNAPASYKPTLFDKHGPAAVHYLTAFKYGAVVFLLSNLMFTALGSRILHLSGLPLLGFTLVGAITLSSAAILVGLRLGDAAGAGAQHVYMGGGSTPYEDQFSQEQALVMQRDYAGALHMFEERLKVTPTDVRVLVAAADLYSTHGENPKRASELYKEVQRLPGVPSGQDVYASNKLADLYLGKLKEPARALVEFRRLMSRYPGSKAEKNARLALDNLKPDLVKGAD